MSSVTASPPPVDQRTPCLLRRGFTLIELLIVVVVIGILAALAFPKYANTKQRASRTAGLADIHNIATQQEQFYSSHGRYGNLSDSAALRLAAAECRRQHGACDDQLRSATRREAGLECRRSRCSADRRCLRNLRRECTAAGRHAGDCHGRYGLLLVRLVPLASAQSRCE
ncbi:MAG: prepilin-type N-terminal cleavage/methylation domain-containing protein [Gemmatimonadaceae bacterium]|nr:prepilin-type N-terminal cleavage/methylation domain-containing protein [Gemmatimonadaceae bacterium]